MMQTFVLYRGALITIENYREMIAEQLYATNTRSRGELLGNRNKRNKSIFSNTLNFYIMASAIITNESNNNKVGVTFQISQSKTLRTMCGLSNNDALGEISKPSRAVKPTEWVLHDDLRFMGQKADNTATYFGLVPKINGVERPDLAIMSDNTGVTSVTHYESDQDEDGEMLPLEDALREAVQTANEKTLAEGGNWEDWWTTLAKLIKGKAIGCLTYRGRRYDNKKVYYGTEMVLY